MKKIVKITGLDCANCAAKLEKNLSKIKGVSAAQINFMAQKAFFEIEDDKVEEVIEEIKKVTHKMEPSCEYKGF